MSRTLLVFAHQDEASAFGDVPHLISGVGKVNAAVSLQRALYDAERAGVPITDIIVLGTAGIVGGSHDLDTVVQIDRAVQHDFSLPTPPLSFGAPTIEPRAVVATGDQFVKDDAQRRHIANLGATLCDMESYAFAAVAEAASVEMRAFKIPSDFADSSTTDEEWDEIVFLKSQQLREFYDAVLADGVEELVAP